MECSRATNDGAQRRAPPRRRRVMRTYVWPFGVRRPATPRRAAVSRRSRSREKSSIVRVWRRACADRPSPPPPRRRDAANAREHSFRRRCRTRRRACWTRSIAARSFRGRRFSFLSRKHKKKKKKKKENKEETRSISQLLLSPSIRKNEEPTTEDPEGR